MDLAGTVNGKRHDLGLGRYPYVSLAEARAKAFDYRKTALDGDYPVTLRAGGVPTFASATFGARCRQAGIIPSMGRKANAYDNAVAESFFATLETELLHRVRFPNRTRARLAIVEFIEGFYNTRRRHSTIGYHSPADYERSHQPTT